MGRKVILGLGDSFLFGEGVDQEKTIMSRLQIALDDAFPRKFRTVNAGVPGYAINHELVYYAAKGESLFDPSVVLVFFYINDVVLGGSSDNMHYWENIPIPNTPEALLKESQNPATIECKLLKFVRYLYAIRPRPLKNVPKEYPKSNRIMLPTEAAMFFTETVNIRNELLYGVEGSYNILKHKVRENGGELVIVYLPTPHETENGVAREKYFRQYTSDESKWDWNGPSMELAKILKKSGIQLINVAPVFERHWNQTHQSVYFNGEGHLSEEGNELVADCVYKELLASGLLVD